MTPPLPASEAKAAHVRAMFDRIAPRYDRLNALLTFGRDHAWRRQAIAAAAPQPGDLVVDVACGTGDLAHLARARGARVLAVDFSPGMLARARRRGIGAAFVRADALALPVRDGRASAVTCGFALRNFTAIPPMLAEAARVLRPGGRLVLLEVATPRDPLRRLVHHLYFDRIVPRLGALLSDRAAYAYLPRSVAYLPPGDTLLALVRSAGFERVTRRDLALGAVQLVRAVRVSR